MIIEISKLISEQRIELVSGENTGKFTVHVEWDEMLPRPTGTLTMQTKPTEGRVWSDMTGLTANMTDYTDIKGTTYEGAVEFIEFGYTGEDLAVLYERGDETIGNLRIYINTKDV